MATEFRLPEVGENIDKATIVNVLVAEGDSVRKEQSVLEIETEKATLEVPSSVSGTVRQVRVKPGDEVKIGSVVLVIDEGAQAAEPSGEETKKESPRAAATPKPARAQTPARVQPAPEAKKSAPAKEEEEEEAVEVEEEVPAEPRAAGEEEEPLGEEAPRPRAVAASPSVRRLAREIGVDIERVKGTGPGGRITPEDVKAQAQQSMREMSARGGTPARQEPLPDFTKWGESERKPMSSIRRITAERLGHAWATIPHVHQFDRADITDLEQLRVRHNARLDDAGDKLTMTAVLLKVVVFALRKYPQFNASLDMEQKEIVYKRFYHIGVAVDTDRGLVVPVIREVDKKSIVLLARELNEAASRARAGKLGLDDMKGATFTITNLGGIGGTNFTPIINPPEVAILGVARVAEESVVRNGKPEIRLFLPLCVGYDHRVIDGADGARFLHDLCGFLANPMDLLLEM